MFFKGVFMALPMLKMGTSLLFCFTFILFIGVLPLYIGEYSDALSKGGSSGDFLPLGSSPFIDFYRSWPILRPFGLILDLFTLMESGER